MEEIPHMVNGRVNFHKQLLVARELQDLLQAKQRMEGYLRGLVMPSEPELTFLTELPYLEGDDLWNMSLSREPRGAELGQIA